MMIVALVATLAGSMVWQQWRAVQVEAAERSRAQSAWILAGALDWARLILREDARSGGPNGIDHLGEPWAVPLAEARLSTFLAADKDNTDDAPDAFLSGSISDVQARYNLRNLVNLNRSIDPEEMLILSRLCETVGVSIDVATRIASGLQAATPVSPAASSASGAIAPPADPPLYPVMTRQLTWFGVDPESVRALEPYVAILPESLNGHEITGQRQHRDARSSRGRDRLGPGDRRAHRPVASARASQVDQRLAGTGACRYRPAPRRMSASSPTSSRCAVASASATWCSNSVRSCSASPTSTSRSCSASASPAASSAAREVPAKREPVREFRFEMSRKSLIANGLAWSRSLKSR